MRIAGIGASFLNNEFTFIRYSSDFYDLSGYLGVKIKLGENHGLDSSTYHYTFKLRHYAGAVRISHESNGLKSEAD